MVAEKSLCGHRRRYGVAQAEIWWVVAQQNRVTPSPFDFGLWTLDLDLDCDNICRQERDLNTAFACTEKYLVRGLHPLRVVAENLHEIG